MTLAHDIAGAGPPLVILHGLFGSARNWNSVARQLAEDRRVWTVDMRNHGASPRHDTMTYDEMAEDLRRFLVTHDLQETAVLGHSMGGKAAMNLALNHPELIGSLIVADIAPAAYSPHHRDLIDAMKAVDLGGLERRSQADAALAPRIPDAGVRAFLTSALETHPDGLRWPFNLAAIDACLDDLSGFPEPQPGQVFANRTLFLAGGRSHYIQPRHHDVIHRLFPNAEIAVIDGAGHWLHAERRDAFVARVRDFLASSG